jgi:hypothetical protein
LILKRHKFAKRSEQISPAQGSLLDDVLNTDLEAIDAELNALLALLKSHPSQALFAIQAGKRLPPMVCVRVRNIGP